MQRKPPPPPKGNKRAIGNHGGAPQIYTAEWIREEAQRFCEWMRLESSIYFKSFAIERGYSPQRFAEFSDKSPEFSEALSIAKEWQEQKLVNLGLFNKTNSSMTKFVLVNCHDWDKEQEKNNSRSHVERLAESIRSEVVCETEDGDSDIE